MNPKERFLRTAQAKTFADVATSEAFQLALDYAMLEMQHELPMVGSEFDDRMTTARLRGAQQLRRILEHIAVPIEIPGPVRSPTINYDAYNKPTRGS